MSEEYCQREGFLMIRVTFIATNFIVSDIECAFNISVENDVKRFFILNFNHYSELEGGIERVIFYDNKNFNLMIMDSDKNYMIVNKTVLNLNS